LPFNKFNTRLFELEFAQTIASAESEARAVGATTVIATVSFESAQKPFEIVQTN